MFCVTLAEKNVDEIFKKIESLSELTELFELRVDALENPSKEALQKVLTYPFKFIFTFRSHKEGGRKKISTQAYLDWILWALQQPFYLVDIEWRFLKKNYKDFNLTNSKYEKILVSYHNFNRTPEKGYLKKMLFQMKERGIKKAKIVTMGKVFDDGLRLLDLILFAKEIGIDLVTFAMGEEGRLSRVLCLLAGSPFTYVAPSEEEIVAPGQLDLLTAKTIYSNLIKYLPKPDEDKV